MPTTNPIPEIGVSSNEEIISESLPNKNDQTNNKFNANNDPASLVNAPILTITKKAHTCIGMYQSLMVF